VAQNSKNTSTIVDLAIWDFTNFYCWWRH